MICKTSGLELFLLRGHFFRYLLAHRFPEGVGFKPAVAGKLHGYFENVVLVRNDAVGVLQNGLKGGVDVFHELRILFSFDICGYESHRAGAVERHHGVDVVYARRFKFRQIIRHAAGGELKDAVRFAAREHFIRLLVIEGQALQLHFRIQPFADARDGVREDGKVCEAEEVEFKKAGAFDGVHVVLRDYFSALRVELDGHVIRDSRRGNDDSCGVHADVPRVALDFLREVENFARRRVALIHLRQFWHLLERAGDGNGETLLSERYQFRDGIAEAVRVPERACDIADRAARHHGAERAYLRDFLAPVFLPHILNEFVAAVVGEVHVDIRRRRTFRIEESLEREVIFQRIHGRNARQVGDEGTGGAASGIGEDVLLARVPEQVSDDQQVRWIPLFRNDGEFVVDSFLCDQGFRHVASAVARFSERSEFIIGRTALREREFGEN